LETFTISITAAGIAYVVGVAVASLIGQLP
jgi:hypothetical protein